MRKHMRKLDRALNTYDRNLKFYLAFVLGLIFYIRISIMANSILTVHFNAVTVDEVDIFISAGYLIYWFVTLIVLFFSTVYVSFSSQPKRIYIKCILGLALLFLLEVLIGEVAVYADSGTIGFVQRFKLYALTDSYLDYFIDEVLCFILIPMMLFLSREKSIKGNQGNQGVSVD